MRWCLRSGGCDNGSARPDRGRAPWGTAGGGSADSARAADPYEILGIAHGASADEITRAYREQMKQYHPDRVAGLGEELQRVAHRKAVEIQRAYEALRKT